MLKETKKLIRIGEVNYNFYGTRMEIVEYKGNCDVYVKFENGCIVKTQYGAFKKGMVKNPYDLSVLGIGYFGEGKYTTKLNGENTPQYLSWYKMFQRCYDEKFLIKHPSYNDCSVIEEWHNFQNFAKWYDDNYYSVYGERMNLDKDILIKGNKIYSPDTCIFVPQRINLLFVKSNSIRGDLPIGVNRYYDKYKVRFEIGGKRKYIGVFNDPIEAFNSYKNAKQEYIKCVAEEYKSRIPNKLYNAMITYKVEITD